MAEHFTEAKCETINPAWVAALRADKGDDEVLRDIKVMKTIFENYQSEDDLENMILAFLEGDDIPGTQDDMMKWYMSLPNEHCDVLR